MGKILVTGASGHLGRKTLQHLLKRRPAGDLVGLARDPEQAADLAAQGIEIRKGDYFDYGSLLNAFEGVEKVMLIATLGFTEWANLDNGERWPTSYALKTLTPADAATITKLVKRSVT